MNDLIERLREESLNLARNSFHSVDAGLSANLCDEVIDEIERLELENWQLKQACGYPIPADKETPQNPFKCGICDARGFNQQSNR